MLARTEVERVGYWSALTVLALTLLFGLAMALGLVGLSLGGAPYLICLLLAPAFLVMMTALHHQVPPERRLWSHLGVSFAVIYTVLVAIVYYVQLTAARAGGPDLLPFIYTPGTVFFAVDMLGYGFLCLATWGAAPVFGPSSWIRRLFLLHGWLAVPTLIFPALLPVSAGGGGGGGSDLFGHLALLLWCAVFAPLAWLTARYFQEGNRHA